MSSVRPTPQLVQKVLWLASGTAAIATLATSPNQVLAQIPGSTTLPRQTNNNLVFQTSGPARCANVGDWYTTNGNFANSPPGFCLPTDPPANQTTNPLAQKGHTFFISVTAADLAAAGGQVVITIEDAGSGGLTTRPGLPVPLDEIDGQPAGTPGTPDPTRFRLFGLTNPGLIGSATLNPAVNPADAGRDITFPAITQPGVYIVDSVTGEYPVNGNTGLFNNALNNDDNGFRIVANGIQDLLIGQFQGTFQNAQVGAATFDFFFLVGPGNSNVYIRNFDFDGDGQLFYTSPSTYTNNPGSPPSGQAAWNNGGNLNAGGDSRPFNSLPDSGLWQIQIANYGGGFTNQAALEVVIGPPNDDPGRPVIPVLDTPPLRAGNIRVDKPNQTPQPGQVGQPACQTFTVTNLFFTTDIINLSTVGTSPGYAVEFRDAAGTTVLTDTDGDGQVDTGILQPGQSITLSLCITPQPGAPARNETQIVTTSFLDQRVRQQAVQRGLPGANLTPTPSIPVLAITTLGTGNGTGTPNFVIVKRITNVTRNGAVLPGVNFGTVIDDPNDTNDNAAGFAQIPLTGVLALTTDNPVQSGDEVTYTVYFLSDGTAPALDTSICDLIPGATSFIPGSLELKLGNASPASTGTFYTPLAPLPANNSCPIQTNPNGAAIVDLGTVSNASGSNFGFIRFKVRIN